MPRKPANEAWEARRFGLILAALLAILAAWSGWRGKPERAPWLAGAALVVVACALFLLPLWLALFRRWMKVVLFLSLITTALLMGLFFFGVLTPFGLLRRRLGKSPIDLGFGDGRAPSWIDRDSEEPTLERYEKPF